MNTLTCREIKFVEFAAGKILRHCPAKNKSLHCSLLTAGDYIVAYGVNKENNVRTITYRKRALHAEENLLKRFFRTNPADSIGKLTLYNIRFLRDGTLANSHPCEKCSSLLKHPLCKPRRIYYSTEEGFQQWLP